MPPNTLSPESKFPLGQRVLLPGHFLEPVTLENVRFIGSGYECRVRLGDGTPDEAILSLQEAEALAGQALSSQATVRPGDAEKLRLLVESARIRLAYAHDRQFAVSLSGIRTLPHQIEAVYMKMLPQPRLRFLLADDPGAGKTIMAGLLLKEMKLREAIERILILCPAPLTIQWQDELLRWFGEPFEVIFSAVDQQQLVSPWQRATQVIASLDYAKQEDVRERVWQQRWDLIIVDEAHKCSAYTKVSSGRGDEVEKTRRYQLAERLAVDADHLLLLTATPHHGDDDRFGHFVRLIDPDLFPEPTRVGDRAGEIRRDILSLGENCPWALRRLKEDLRDIQGHRLFPDRHAHTVTFKLNQEEFDLYKAVTAYINEFLPQASLHDLRYRVRTHLKLGEFFRCEVLNRPFNWHAVLADHFTVMAYQFDTLNDSDCESVRVTSATDNDFDTNSMTRGASETQVGFEPMLLHSGQSTHKIVTSVSGIKRAGP